jgi:hypothetical protein
LLVLPILYLMFEHRWPTRPPRHRSPEEWAFTEPETAGVS